MIKKIIINNILCFLLHIAILIIFFSFSLSGFFNNHSTCPLFICHDDFCCERFYESATIIILYIFFGSILRLTKFLITDFFSTILLSLFLLWVWQICNSQVPNGYYGGYLLGTPEYRIWMQYSLALGSFPWIIGFIHDYILGVKTADILIYFAFVPTILFFIGMEFKRAFLLVEVPIKKAWNKKKDGI